MLSVCTFWTFALLFSQIVSCAFFSGSTHTRKWRPRLARPISYDPSATLCLKNLINDGEFRFIQGLDKILVDVDTLEILLASGAEPPDGYNELSVVLLNYFRLEDFGPVQLLKKVYRVEFTSNTHLMHAIWSGCLMNVRAVIECCLCGHVPTDDHAKMKCWAFPFPDILFYLITKAGFSATSQDLRNAVGVGRHLAVSCLLSMNVEINEEVLEQQMHGGTVETLSCLLKNGLNASVFLGKVCSEVFISPYPILPLDRCRACLDMSVTISNRYLDMIEMLWSFGASSDSVNPHMRFLVDYVQARKMYAFLATGQGEFSLLLPELRRLILLMMLNIHC